MSKGFFDLTPEVFRTLAENSVDAIAIGDLEGKMTYGNRACYDLFGYEYEKEEMMGLPFVSFWREEDIPLLSEEVLPQAMAGGWRGEVRLKRKDGGLFDAYLAMFGLIDEAGQPLGATAIIRDITEGKRAEEALAQERNLLRTIIDNLPDYIYVKDTESRYVVSNTAHVRFLGATTPDEVIGKSVLELYPQELAAQYYANDQGVIRSGQPLLKREERSVDQAGNMVWLLTTKVPLRDRDGKIVGLVGIARDITEQKRAEEALAEERNLLRTIIDNLPHYIYVKDTESRYVVSNIAHMRVLGATTPDDVIGKSVFELYPQELAAQYYADDQEVIRSGQPLLDREERSVDQMGNMVWDLTTKAPLRDSDGKIVGLVGIARDITESKQAQEVIEAQRQALRELSTPIVPVLEGVLVLPLVGSIDTRRAQQVMETLLEAVGRHQAEVVIIDITGVPVVDTGVANHLLQVTKAAALLGAECVLVGISPDVAQTIVALGVDLSGITTKADLQAGIERALEITGKKIVPL